MIYDHKKLYSDTLCKHTLLTMNLTHIEMLTLSDQPRLSARLTKNGRNVKIAEINIVAGFAKERNHHGGKGLDDYKTPEKTALALSYPAIFRTVKNSAID